MQKPAEDHRRPLLLSLLILSLAVWLADAMTPVHAQLRREPAIARDEALRLVPESGPRPLMFEELPLSPDEQRRRYQDLLRSLSPATQGQAELRVVPLEGYLDFDQEDQIVYSPGRTVIVYEGMRLEADRVLLDVNLQEFQAEGDIILEAQGNTIQADSVRFDIDDFEGVAFNVDGNYGPVFFQTSRRVDPDGADPGQLQIISEHESIFRSTDVTSCDFTVPHYYVRAREVVLFPQDRIFLRGATLYVTGVPVMYLPVYSRSLLESSPWFIKVGYGSRSGARLRVGYSYQHRTEEPSFEDDDDMLLRSWGRADIYADYLSRIGGGMGFDYRYMFEFGRHEGELSIYGLADGEREVFGASETGTVRDSDLERETERWRFFWRHRSQVTEDLTLLFNVDEFSDPDIFYDVLDLFSDDGTRRRREIERRARVAATFVQEAYVVRLMADIKDRIGLDRLNNFSDPRDDNRDFDRDPYNELDENAPDGIGQDRWGRVAARVPQLDAATRWLPARSNRWFYRSELHLYNALDKALNIIDEEDDAFVQGVEFYQQLMRQWKLGQRYTLLAKVGLGFGGADRDHRLGYDVGRMGVALDGDDDPNTNPDDYYPRVIDGLTFVDAETFLIGQRRKHYDQLRNSYMWADTQLQMNARFSDALSGWLLWRLRETTDDFLGDWYASLGSRTVREDLYNYKLREHWLEARLDYRLLRPLLSVYTGYGWNLIGDDDIYPQEPLGYWTAGTRWSNRRQTLVANAGVRVTRRQIFDTTDPRAFEENEWGLGQGIMYSPIHQRWYILVDNNVRLTQNSRAESSRDRRLTFFSDEDTDGELKVVYGREIGPKWDTEVEVEYDYELGGLGEFRWQLQRDLHDAVAVLEVRAERDYDHADSRDDRSSMEYDIRTGLHFKLPGSEATIGPGEVQTLRQAARQPAIAR